MWSMTEDDGLPFAECQSCRRRYPVSVTECRECHASPLVVEPRPDGSRRIYLPGQLNFARRQEMSRAAAEARRKRGAS
jgi:hypothetical protein